MATLQQMKAACPLFFEQGDLPYFGTTNYKVVGDLLICNNTKPHKRTKIYLFHGDDLHCVDDDDNTTLIDVNGKTMVAEVDTKKGTWKVISDERGNPVEIADE